MQLSFTKHEIDHHVLRLIVGIIALTLANLTAYFSPTPLESISASYHADGWSRDIFVGSLFAVFAFLLAYNGEDATEAVLSKVAAFAAIGVAMFPCRCGDRPEIIPYLHSIASIVMFLVLAGLCVVFYRRARGKQRREADWRAVIYAGCAAVILAAIAVLAYDGLTDGSIQARVPRLVFYGERAGLMAFAISWLVASRALPMITAADERVHMLPFARGAGGQP